MKRTATLLLALIMVCSLLAGCGDKGTTDDSSNNANTDENPTVAITFCNMLATDHPQSIAATEVLAPEISEKTGGKFTIDVQVNGALGSDAEATEATIMGTMNSCGPACATLASFDPNWYILDVPYVFKSKEHARAALDGELGEFLSGREQWPDRSRLWRVRHAQPLQQLQGGHLPRRYERHEDPHA